MDTLDVVQIIVVLGVLVGAALVFYLARWKPGRGKARRPYDPPAGEGGWPAADTGGDRSPGRKDGASGDGDSSGSDGGGGGD
jgi:hypothetical protein